MCMYLLYNYLLDNHYKNNDWLVKVIMLEALEIGSKVRWVRDLQQSLEKLGWRRLNVVALDGLTIMEVKQLLKDTTWRRVRAVWREKAKGSSKLEMTGKLMNNECKARCVGWIVRGAGG